MPGQVDLWFSKGQGDGAALKKNTTTTNKMNRWFNMSNECVSNTRVWCSIVVNPHFVGIFSSSIWTYLCMIRTAKKLQQKMQSQTNQHIWSAFLVRMRIISISAAAAVLCNTNTYIYICVQTIIRSNHGTLKCERENALLWNEPPNPIWAVGHCDLWKVNTIFGACLCFIFIGYFGNCFVSTTSACLVISSSQPAFGSFSASKHSTE